MTTILDKTPKTGSGWAGVLMRLKGRIFFTYLQIFKYYFVMFTRVHKYGTLGAHTEAAAVERDDTLSAKKQIKN